MHQPAAKPVDDHVIFQLAKQISSKVRQMNASPQASSDNHVLIHNIVFISKKEILSNK